MSDQKKSPRDWLLARHAHTQPQLDALRRAALSASAMMSAARRSEPVTLTWGELFLELIRPHRGTWRALALVWLALAFLQLTNLRRSASVPQPGPSSAAITAWPSQLKSHETFAQIDRRP